jgi:CRISPR-associated protein Cas2
MILITYDFTSDKTRTKFSKFLRKYGRRIQYSVFLIRNSERILSIIKKEIEMRYSKMFTNLDSIVIVNICKNCHNKTIRYGNASYEEEDVICLE